MRRKLVKQGQNALTVTLPAKWAKQNGLEAGDEVEIGEAENGLIILSSKEVVQKAKRIALETRTIPQIRSVIASAYKAGYDEIILESDRPIDLAEVNSIINTITGLEIVSQKGNTLVIKSFLRTSEEDVENIMTKMFQIALLIARTVRDDWDKADINNLETLAKSNQIKLRDHALRSIHSSKYGGDKSYDYYDFVTILEKISAAFYELALAVRDNRIRKSPQAGEMVGFLEKLYESYLKKDIMTSNMVWVGMRKELERVNSKNISKTLGNKDPVLFTHYYFITKLFRHISSRIVALSN